MDNRETVIINNDKSGKMYSEKYIKNNYNDIYLDVINFCKNKLSELPFKQKMYHFVNDIKEEQICKNPNCNNKVKYKNSTIGYYDYCSVACISSDPKIKEIKEKKSFEKYGTKTPAMNNKIKNKIILTNIKKYKSKSPLQNNKILKKSKETLMNNYGVDNPNKNIEISKKRVKTFSNNIKNKYLRILKDKGIKNIDYDKKIMYFNCTECNKDFDLPIDLYHNRNRLKTILCIHCNPIDKHISGQEILLKQFILNNYKNEVIFNDREKIKPYELDIFLPKLNIGIEFNGLFYHNELNVEKNYHLKKTELSEKNGIKLIQIWEDDWLYKQDIVKSILLNKLGLNDKIYARKTEVKEIKNNTIVKNFLINNHIQGFIGSQIKIGLFYNNELVSLMTFGKQRKNLGSKSKENTYELLRFCNKLNTNVVGGASKLFKYFINNYKPIEIITYADRFFSQGNLYDKLNFKFIHKTTPNYYYVVNKIKKNRFNYRKDILIKEGYDPNKSEKEIMFDRKIYRIYDSGQLKYIWIN